MTPMYEAICSIVAPCWDNTGPTTLNASPISAMFVFEFADVYAMTSASRPAYSPPKFMPPSESEIMLPAWAKSIPSAPAILNTAGIAAVMSLMLMPARARFS